MNHPRKQSHLVNFSIDARSFGVTLDRLAARQRICFFLRLISTFPSEVSIRFCDIAEMQSANLMFRKKNKPTDVLTFPIDPRLPLLEKSAKVFLGDILICLPVCQEQARAARHSLSHEVERMVLHGLCHLKGFDHERDEAAWRVQTNLETDLRRIIVAELGSPEWLNA